MRGRGLKLDFELNKDKKLTGLYWDIGKMIVARQKKHNCRKSIVENLAKDLQNEFPGIRGFSAENFLG